MIASMAGSKVSVNIIILLCINIIIALQLHLVVNAQTETTIRISHYDAVLLNRSSFPPSFIFGTASASYQYEGAAREGGRGPSIWDIYTHKYPANNFWVSNFRDEQVVQEIIWNFDPERIQDGSNGDVANDQYHRYKEDVGIMKDMNLDAYRFSISWSRLLPNGKLSGGVNKEGIKYYNNLINELLAHGLTPFVTLFHWDLPQPLEEQYGGFLSPKIVKPFRDYAELCFREFGDRVKHWITLNEPWTYATGGYVNGMFPPGRCSNWQNLKCLGGDSSTEPYLAAHNLILSHAAAVKTYRDKYQASQKGWIGITLVSHWFVPYSNAKHHQNAALRAIDFMFGWYMDPLVNGDYPRSMRSLVGKRLPTFTTEQAKSVKGSYDFLGLNYYTANYAAYAPNAHNTLNISYNTDSKAKLTSDRNGVSIGPPAASAWLRVYPQGFYEILKYTKTKYNNPLIYITENGIDEVNDPKLSLEQALIDIQRIDYYFRHLSYLQNAIKDGVKVKGYFAWSLLDNFEWSSGYTVRFGINFVDYKNDQKRYPKLSAHWFKSFLKK